MRELVLVELTGCKASRLLEVGVLDWTAVLADYLANRFVREHRVCSQTFSEPIRDPDDALAPHDVLLVRLVQELLSEYFLQDSVRVVDPMYSVRHILPLD